MKEIRNELENQKQNRELIGVDRAGNKYYQYYSFFGLPTKRMIEFKDQYSVAMNDLAFFDWLTNRQTYAPTPEELDQYYNEYEQRKILGQQWDQQQAQLIQAYYDQQKVLQQQAQEKIKQINATVPSELLDEIQEKVAIEEQTTQTKPNEDYKPQQWKGKAKRR